MNNDRAASRFDASETGQEIRLPLTVIRQYFCDKGIHSGTWYVKLEGYLAPEQIKLLNSLIEDSTTADTKQDRREMKQTHQIDATSMRYRVVWPDGSHYEEDEQNTFSKAKSKSIINALAGTIAGDAKMIPADTD